MYIFCFIIIEIIFAILKQPLIVNGLFSLRRENDRFSFQNTAHCNQLLIKKNIKLVNVVENTDSQYLLQKWLYIKIN